MKQELSCVYSDEMKPFKLSAWAKLVSGPNTNPVRPNALVRSWFFQNMAAPFSEDLNELFLELVKYIFIKKRLIHTLIN